jgi:chromosome segregation ATPase
MGRYQKSKPFKKVHVKTEKIRKERQQRWQHKQQQVQEEVIETLALGVEELVVKMEEKEKELVEVVDHEIELAEEVMNLEGKREGLQKDLGRERRWNEVQKNTVAQEHRQVSEKSKEIESMRISVANRDDHIRVYQESIRNLREQVGDRDREIRELKRLHGLD